MQESRLAVSEGSGDAAPGRNIWTRAADVAARTPESRNRYVDFLRALSIGAVVTGHWLIVAPYVRGGEASIGSMLEYQPWTHWLSWVFQVMPVFFLVGGYSNAVSWRSAVRSGRSYEDWLLARLERLIGPVLPLLVAWALLAAGAGRFGVRPEMIKVASQMALVPIWFLAVYVMVVVLVPVTHAAWERFGLRSFWVLVIAAAVDDTLFFAADLRAVGWLNYAFVWLAVHQLGYAWRDGFVAGSRKGLSWALGGAIVLIGLVAIGPYPVAMVSVQGQDVSNTLPPKLTMLAMGIVQSGLLLSFEAPMRRWLTRAAPWTATVLVNSMIMTIFLWHLTASTLVIGAALLLGDAGLTVIPGSAMWWAMRPVWLGMFALALVPFSLGFGRFERAGASGRAVPAKRLVAGAALVCGGLALLALGGVGGDGWLGLRIGVLLLPFLGAVLAGINPLARNR